MKRKIFSVLFALVLLASFSLVTAVPVTVSANPGGAEFEAGGDHGTAEWSTDQFEVGGSSAKLYVEDGAVDWAQVSIPVDIAIKDITELKIWEYIEPAGTNRELRIYLGIDSDGDGDFEADVYQWISDQNSYSADPADLYGDTFIIDWEIHVDPSMPAGAWTERDILAGTEGFYTPNAAGDGWSSGTMWGTGIDDFIACLNTPLPWLSPPCQFFDPGRVEATDKVKVIVVWIGRSTSWLDAAVYVDDLTMNGDPYEVERIPPPVEVWVDDGFIDEAAVDAFNPDLTLGIDAFATIQEGINVVAEAGTVNVAEGTYAPITIDVPNLTLTSTGATEDTIIDTTGSWYGIKVVSPNLGDITIDGFKVTAGWDHYGIWQHMDVVEGTAVHILNNIVKATPGGHGNSILFCGVGSTVIGNEVEAFNTPGSSAILAFWPKDVTIQNNHVYGAGCAGIDLDGDSGHFFEGCVVENNTVENNLIGVRINYTKNALITYNDIRNNDIGVDISEPTPGTEVHSNNIVGNTDYGVKNGTAVNVDATQNWWGTAVEAEIAGMVDGPVDYSPWWGASYLSGTAPAIELVDHPWTWYTNDSIQDAIDAALAGDTVNVAAGEYTENVTIDKTLTLQSTELHEANIEGSGQSNYSVTILATGVILKGFDIQGGVQVKADDVTVAYNRITAVSSRGILYDSSPPDASGGTVTHNVVSAPGNLGIYLDHDGGTFTVTHNTVEARKAIGFGSLSGGVIAYNTISSPSSDCDIEVFDANIATVNYNNLLGEVWNVESSSIPSTQGDTLDATHNWWGTPNGPSATAVTGDVDCSPWLPGEWELFYDSEGNLKDTDEDGFSDLDEYWLGTNPTDPESCPGAPVGEVDTAYVEGDDQANLQDSAGTIADVGISGAPSDASGTITGTRYTDELEPIKSSLSVGTGTTGVVFLDVKVTGYDSGWAHITVPYPDHDPEDSIVDGTDIFEHTLSLYYLDDAVSPAVWRLADNNTVDRGENNVSGDIPISALTGTPIGMGGYLADEAVVAIDSILNLSDKSDPLSLKPDTVELTIVTNTASLSAATIYLMFDPTVVEVLGVEEVEVGGKLVATSDFDTLTVNPEYGFIGNDTQIACFVVHQSGADGVNATGDGALVAVVKLQAADNSSTMDFSSLNLEVDTLKDNKGDRIPCTFWVPSFAIVGGVGDANRDTYVDIADVVAIERAIAGFIGHSKDPLTMNVDAKDDVDAYDCTYLARHFIDLDYPLPPDGWMPPWGPWPPWPPAPPGGGGGSPKPAP